MATVNIRRVYEDPQPDDGVRVLVDRVWPRGLTKDRVQADKWMKDIAPSSKLRKWFGHDPEKWDEFRERYFLELDDKPELVEELRKMLRSSTVTLLYSAKDVDYNQAVALREYLENKRG
ncbi:hypothetical protein DPQ33_02590 [Oceanidesulfovibrio indonesiensis]|uniref:DUF488 domain-containing protein n=1 Tax=Oceanidesulfovibrio indonesiensis TaxID=54767 RepID=A0A7M3MHU9_9BACT|nr:DUF488 domain-containing protein [Oceanidesulfovibrio indonesiensis]TVM19266.1 hypothetical protein DPQ33_02590 [Oceanidesulfovibrio indonesiensis]